MEDMQSTGEDPIKGGTGQKLEDLPLYETNNKHLQKRYQNYNQQLGQFVMQAFQASQALPKIKGKPIESLDQIPSLIEKYGNDLYEQAKTVVKNPDIDDGIATQLLIQQKKVDDTFGYIAQANQMMFKDLKNAANSMDAKMKVQGWHSLLLTKDGQLKSPEQAKKDISAFRSQLINQEMEKWKQQNPVPQNRPIFLQRTDMPNPMAGKYFTDIDGKVKQIDSRPKMINSQEGYMMLEQTQFDNVNYQYRNLNYDDILKRLLEEYNKNPNTKKLVAAAEGLADKNAGGIRTAVSKQEFKFDVDDAVDEDFNLKPEMNYTINLLQTIADNNDIKFAQGDLNETNIKIPSESDASAQTMIKTILEDLMSEGSDPNRKRGSDKRTAGSISFVPISGGDENYHAYHIKMPASYFSKHLGTEKNPGIARDADGKNRKYITSGITVYVPKNISATTMIGRESTKGSTISPVEGMINLSGDNSFTRRIDDAIEYRIALDRKNGEYVVTGNAVAYNLETAKMDTFKIENLGIKNRWDLSVDLDKLDKDLYKIGLQNFQLNRALIKEHSQAKGVRDPKQLSGN